ncbi:MAG: methyltransferase domain-containing protein [Planctomycetota bacterium]
MIDKRQVARRFSRAANEYDQRAALQNQIGDRLLELIQPDWMGRLIDLGCGTGRLLKKLESRDRLILHGIDLSPGMIDFARQQTRAKLICGDIESTPYDDHSFDIAISNAALQWCSLDSAFSEVRRLLIDGGRFAFTTFGANTLNELRSVLQEIDPTRSHVHSFPDETMLRAALQRHGFSQIKLAQEELFDIPQDPADLLQNLRRIGAGYAGPAAGQHYFGRKKYQQLIDELWNRYRMGSQFGFTYDTFFVSCVATG